MITPEDTAFVPTSASSRGGVPSEKKRSPVPNIVGSAAQQQIERLAVSRHDGLSPCGVGMRRRSSAVLEAVTCIFLRPAGGLNHAVQRDVFDDLDLSHAVSFITGSQIFCHCFK